MSLPSIFAPVKPQHFTLTPFKVHKTFNITSTDLQTTGSGYNLVEGLYSSIIVPIGSNKADNDPTNALDGSYKYIIWRHLDHLYYRNAYVPGYALEHTNERYNHKFINISASYLSIPYLDYGESIKPKSVKITNGDLEVIDDEYGNLYDTTLKDNLSQIENYNVIGYWGFNEIFRKFKFNYGKIEHDSYSYKTYTHVPEQSIVHGVNFVEGVSINGTGSGLASEYEDGYILTQTHNHFNFDNDDEFTISFYINPSANLNTGSVISKNGVVLENQLGYFEKENPLTYNISNKKYIYTKYADKSIDEYPFDICYYGTELKFSRSDGIKVAELTAPVPTDEWTHIAVTRYKENDIYKLKMYANGLDYTASVIDNTNNPINEHCIMFGAKNKNLDNQYLGKLDEVRFINRSYDDEWYNGLSSEDNCYNSAVVGNVFYKNGNIVISPLLPKYKNLLSGSFGLTYKSTHTVYQYEVVCTIPKGSFNVTTNPTSLRSPKSDLYIDEFITDGTGSLSPYFSSIGLYNDHGELLAIAKTAQAIQVRADVDLNVLIKFDA